MIQTWIRPICQKPKIKCGDCENRDFIPLSDDVIRNHLIGIDPADRYRHEFVIGVYPMLVDETCWFLAVDFDKETWKEDSRAYLETCGSFNAPAALERSRSGNGGHIWIFFSEPIPAKLALQLGAFMLTQAMESRPEMGFDSYDRFFPSQDTLPRGGFGDLIALPLQRIPREKGNSLFVDENFDPYRDQWRFLSAIAKRSVNTLILVHLKKLLYQWIDRLNAFLNVSVNDIGQIGGGKRKPTGIIDVATIQSLGRKGVVDDIVAEYGHLVVDECHHISARSFEIFARQCKAKFVTGLSATVTR
jgi:hypothetical protein